jgi:hypothetical protein
VKPEWDRFVVAFWLLASFGLTAFWAVAVLELVRHV